MSKIPFSGARPINSDPDFARAIPVTNDRQIGGESERTQKSVDRRAIPLTIAIEIQIPLDVLRAKDADLFSACAVPVADYW